MLPLILVLLAASYLGFAQGHRGAPLAAGAIPALSCVVKRAERILTFLYAEQEYAHVRREQAAVDSAESRRSYTQVPLSTGIAARGPWRSLLQELLRSSDLLGRYLACV